MKRDREMKLKQRAADKAARKAARQAGPVVGKGPPIDWASLNENPAPSPGDAPTPDDSAGEDGVALTETE